MKLPRRQILHLAAGAAALPAVSRIASAQIYPSRPVRIIVGFAPAGGTDIMARLIGQWLSDRLGQQFVIENRSGAGTNIATEAVVNAPPDGYTLLLACLPNASNATLYENLKFNFIHDITPVAGIAREPFAIEVNPSVPVKTVPEFITHAKASRGKINMASGGIGSGNHIFGELFKMMTGVNLVHVPYRGAGPALVDLLGGQVLWTGIGAPKNTPAEIVDKLNKEINAALADPKTKARLAAWGATALPGSPADFGKLIAEETEKWGKVVKFAGIKPG